MSAARYTEAGDAALEAVIRNTLAEVADRAARVPGLDALLLGGSLGRGEGTVERGPDGDRLASDIELYLVGRPSSLREAARQLERQVVGEGYGDVSAAWLHPSALESGRGKNLSWKPAHTIRLYELAQGSQALVGGMPAIRPIDPSALPVAEGVRLVLNRLAEAAPEAATASTAASRWADKILIACGDTLLLGTHAYTVRYRDRATRLAAVEVPWPMPDGWRDELMAAYERKLTGITAESTVPAPDRLDAIVVATLHAAIPLVAGVTLEPLESFVPRYVTAGARSHELLRYLPPLGPSATYEGVVVLLRGIRAGLRPTPRAIRQAVLGRPKSLVLQAAALPAFLGIIREDEALLVAATDGLRWGGVHEAELSAASDPFEFARLLRRHWSVAT